MGILVRGKGGTQAGCVCQRVRGYGLMARRRIPDPKIGGSNPSSLTFWQASEGYWSRGMIPALGAGGREFESPIAPLFWRTGGEGAPAPVPEGITDTMSVPS